MSSPRFQPGNTIGRAGKPRGTRNKLAATVFKDVLEFWDQPARDGSDITRGQAALLSMWRSKPAEFVRIVASMLPREFVFENVVSELGDDELDHMITMLRDRALAAREERSLDAQPPKMIEHV
jgi:hypothetical protein